MNLNDILYSILIEANPHISKDRINLLIKKYTPSVKAVVNGSK